MKKIDASTERKLYQVIGILRVISMIQPQGTDKHFINLVENVANAAEGAAATLEDVAFAITSSIEENEAS